MKKDELNSVLDMKARIEAERQKLETLRLCSESIKPAELSDLPKAKNQNSAVERFAVSIIESEQKILALQNELVEVAAKLATKLTSELKNSSPLWLSVMIRRYCGAMTFKEIAATLNFTRNYIQKLHSQALHFLLSEREALTGADVRLNVGRARKSARAKKVLGTPRPGCAAAATSDKRLDTTKKNDWYL